MIGVVIPVFNPEPALIEYVQDILKNPLRPVIIINDADLRHEVFVALLPWRAHRFDPQSTAARSRTQNGL